MSRLSWQWYHYRYKVDMEDRSPLFPRTIINQEKLTHGYICIDFQKRKKRKKCKIEKNTVVHLAYFLFSPFSNKWRFGPVGGQRGPGIGQHWSSDTMFRGDGWCLPSSPHTHCNHLAGVRSLSFTPTFIYTCEGLLEEWNINYPAESLWMPSVREKWGNF